MKAYYFEGDMGNKVIQKEIPADMMADAQESITTNSSNAS
jgi:hypothetical protein